jgi:hypothetical protein
MVVLRTVLISFMLVISACTSQGPATFPDGTIEFTSDPNDPRFTCGFALVDGDQVIHEGQDNRCNNDRLNYFRLNTAPSATEVEFFSEHSDPSVDGKCPLPSQETRYWRYKIRTYIHPVSTIWVSFAELRAKKVGDIVTRGVVLIENHYLRGDNIDELSCVQITRSPLP